jgi:hypothetical protein
MLGCGAAAGLLFACLLAARLRLRPFAQKRR